MKKIFFFVLLMPLLTFGQTGRRIEVLFLGDQGHHRPMDRLPSLMAALGPRGINFTYTEDLSDLNPENLSWYDAIMIYANWSEIAPEQEKALLDFVAAGKGLIPVHCASYCFRNSPEYVKMVGGQFWRHTMDSVRTDIIQGDHPAMKGLNSFTSWDETYLHSQLQPDNLVLATRPIKKDQENDKPGEKTEPYTWVRTHGKGKIFYTAYGHDENTWSKPGFHDMMFNAVLWVVPQEARLAFEARNPKPFEYKEAKLPNYEQRPGKQLQQLPLSPEESMKHIQVPPQFKLELFAAEPNVQHPIAITWDERGRMFVLITKDYPNERKDSGGSDFILMCEDTNGDGKADRFKRFAEGLSIPTGMVFANGGLIVSQAPDMLFLQDTDGDDVADVKKKLFTGFGTFDTHAGPSNLHYGFDNWIWGCVGYSGFKGKLKEGDSLKFGQGFFRFKPDGSRMEWMTSTSNNTWGFSFNETNDVFGSTANNSHGWYMAIPNSYFNSDGRTENGSRSTDTHRDMKPITTKVRQVDAFGGFTAAAGHNFYTARAFPKKYWNQVAFVAEPTGHVLHQNNLIRRGTDYYDTEAFNLMAGADEWFSPVFAETGPDGAVWVADWYSYIIQHNPVPQGFDNGTGNAYETDLRDYTHGRIYRVSHKKAGPYAPFVLNRSNVNGLLSALASDNMFWRMQAQRLLVERGNKDVLPQLAALVSSNKVDELGINPTAVHALWTMKGLDGLDEATLNVALRHPQSEVVKNALKTMDPGTNTTKKILELGLLSHPDELVVLNALLLISKATITIEAEEAIFKKLEELSGSEDRWFPDAFSCVFTAENGKLMKKYLKKLGSQSKTSTTSEMKPVQNDKDTSIGKREVVEGVDLIVKSIKVEPSSPAVRERINVSVEILNQGTKNLDTGKFVPFFVRFEGNGLKQEQLSRNYKGGIPAGQSVWIEKNINGPWVGNLAFSTDIAGDYSLTVQIDRNGEITEGNERNNFFRQAVRFSDPPTIGQFGLLRAVRGYASVASADSIVSIMKLAERLSVDDRRSLYKAAADGWNYRKKNIKVSTASRNYMLALKNPDENQKKLMEAWGVAKPAATAAARVIRIKTIKDAMKFDLTEFTVKPGENIELVLENPDAMQHNLVIVKPGNQEKVGKAADKMLQDPKGVEKNYIPSLPEVLFYTPLVNGGQSFRLKFKAPSTAGDYPFICTFPAHWRLMQGVMKVR